MLLAHTRSTPLAPHSARMLCAGTSHLTLLSHSLPSPSQPLPSLPCVSALLLSHCLIQT